MVTESWRNQERTGRRKVTRLSTVARRVQDIRAIDIDLVPYCPDCKKPIAFCEVKRTVVSDAEWDQMRRHAAFYGHKAIAVLVVETDAGQIGVKVYDSDDNVIHPLRWGDEEHLIKILETARDAHECW